MTDISIHFNEDNFLEANEHINTFFLLGGEYNKLNKLQTSPSDLNDDDIDTYDTLFRANKIIYNSNILYVEGTIGYSGDFSDVKYAYDMNVNKIYILSTYRMLSGNEELELYKDTFEMCYDKYWKYEDNKLVEYIDKNNYNSIGENSIPYYRFPRTKDGINIPRSVHNIFKVFGDENAIKPKIIIPNGFNIYSSIKKE
jgi:hypothetical protein